MRIIPAIDIIAGQCVRLVKGNYNQKTVYRNNPLDVAKEFEQAGIQYLHLVDLDGAKKGEIVNLEILRKISLNTNLKIDFGGGIKSLESAKTAIEAGAYKLNLGSIAVKNPVEFEKIIHVCGGDKIILSADVKNKKIALSGWQENSGLDIIPFIESYRAKGVKQVVCTDISRDGMLQGPAYGLYKELLVEFSDMEIIASGGVCCFKDLEELQELGVHGVIIGKAIYEGRISLDELKKI